MIRARVVLAGLYVTFATPLVTNADAQAAYAATGPGTYISVGVAGSAMQSDYGKRQLGGATVFVDAHLYRRIGVEFEARQLKFHSSEGIGERTYLVGPKISFKPRTVRPYVKLLAGRGQFTFPFNYAKGSYFVFAPGGGLDWRIDHSRVSLRLLDFEYQVWPGFTFGAMHPYGISSGVSFQVFEGPRR